MTPSRTEPDPEDAPPPALRVLVIEDRPDDVELIRAELAKGGAKIDLRSTDSADGMRSLLESERFDVILSDYVLPRFGAMKALEIAKKAVPDTPFLIISGRIGEETAVEGMKAGADDYLMKDNLARLGPAVERARREAEVRRQRRTAEKQRDTLIRELDHRVRNNLAVVLSLTEQTAAESTSVPQFRDALTSRIRALAEVHDLLAASKWSGADIHEIVLRRLHRHAEVTGRIGIEGPQAQLDPATSSALGLALQELVSNARRHGSLSRPEGRVDVRWSPVPDRDCAVRLIWTESGGPPVRPPEHEGLGLRLINVGLSYDARADVRLDFAPNGFEMVATIPTQSPPSRLSA